MEGADWRAGDKKRTGAFKGTWWINSADSETPPEVCHRPFCLERPDAEDLDLRQHGASWLVFNAFVRCRALQRLHLCTQRHTNPPITPIFLFGRRLSASSSRPRPSCSSAPQVKPLLLTVGDKAQRCVCVGGRLLVRTRCTHAHAPVHALHHSVVGRRFRVLERWASIILVLVFPSPTARFRNSALNPFSRWRERSWKKKKKKLHPTLCGCNDGPGRPRYEWLHAGKRSPSNRQTGSLWKDHGLKAGAALCSGQTLRKRPCGKELRQLLQSR